MKLLFILLMFMFTVFSPAQNFTHPGIIHSQESLNRIRKLVKAGKEPWKSSFERLESYPQASSLFALPQSVRLSS